MLCALRWTALCVLCRHADTGTLSLDLLGISEESMQRLNEVAQALSAALVARFPGARVAASAVPQMLL